jgi:hypothetical protein
VPANITENTRNATLRAFRLRAIAVSRLLKMIKLRKLEQKMVARGGGGFISSSKNICSSGSSRSITGSDSRDDPSALPGASDSKISSIEKPLIRSLSTRLAASKLRPTLRLSLSAQQRANKTQYCMFYNLFGKCNKEDSCRYLHDPDKVSICRQFLRGTCDKSPCLLKHIVSAERMTVCHAFLRGECADDACPYSHVRVNSKAAACPDFLKGFCPLGSLCKLRHVRAQKPLNRPSALELEPKSSQNAETKSNDVLNSGGMLTESFSTSITNSSVLLPDPTAPNHSLRIIPSFLSAKPS